MTKWEQHIVQFKRTCAKIPDLETLPYSKSRTTQTMLKFILSTQKS